MPPTFTLKPAAGGTTLHHQVYLVLRDLLLAGKYQPGEQLPIEPDLAAQFGVSRITLRRAVEDLQRDGYLTRIHGKGTFASASNPQLAKPEHQNSYMFDMRHVADTDIVVLEHDTLPAPEDVARRLRIAMGSDVMHSVRMRVREGIPLLLLDAWVSTAYTRGITRKALQTRNLIDLIAKNGVSYGRVQQELRAVLADPVQSGRLQVPIGTALLQSDRVVHDTQGTPIQYVRVTICSAHTLMVIDTPADVIDRVSTGHFVRTWSLG